MVAGPLMRVWDAESYRIIAQLDSDADEPSHAELAPDSRRIVTSYGNRRPCIFRLMRLSELSALLND
jgi:hypothetical protein